MSNLLYCLPAAYVIFRVVVSSHYSQLTRRLNATASQVLSIVMAAVIFGLCTSFLQGLNNSFFQAHVSNLSVRPTGQHRDIPPPSYWQALPPPEKGILQPAQAAPHRK